MKSSDLVYVGINGHVVALDRANGTAVWKTHLKGSDFVNVTLDGDNLYALTHGEIFCLDPMTGDGRWQNPLKGFGTGLATVATVNSSALSQILVMAEKRRRDQQAAAAASSAGAAS